MSTSQRRAARRFRERPGLLTSRQRSALGRLLRPINRAEVEMLEYAQVVRNQATHRRGTHGMMTLHIPPRHLELLQKAIPALRNDWPDKAERIRVWKLLEGDVIMKPYRLLP